MDMLQTHSKTDALTRLFGQPINKDTVLQFIELNRNNLTNFAWRYCRNREDAQDAVQAAVVKVSESQAHLPTTWPKMASYVSTIVCRNAIDMVRTRKRHLGYSLDTAESLFHHPAHADPSLRAIEDFHIRETIRLMCKDLSPNICASLHCVVDNPVTTEEGAALLGIPAKTHRGRIDMGRTFIQQKMAPHLIRRT